MSVHQVEALFVQTLGSSLILRCVETIRLGALLPTDQNLVVKLHLPLRCVSAVVEAKEEEALCVDEDWHLLE